MWLTSLAFLLATVVLFESHRDKSSSHHITTMVSLQPIYIPILCWECQLPEYYTLHGFFSGISLPEKLDPFRYPRLYAKWKIGKQNQRKKTSGYVLKMSERKKMCTNVEKKTQKYVLRVFLCKHTTYHNLSSECWNDVFMMFYRPDIMWFECYDFGNCYMLPG